MPNESLISQRQAFADNVRIAREKAGLTQEQDTVFKVAGGLGVPPAELFPPDQLSDGHICSGLWLLAR